MKFCDDLHCGLMDYEATESGRRVTTFERHILPQFASFDFLRSLNKLCAGILYQVPYVFYNIHTK